LDIIHLAYHNYDGKTDSGEVWLECPTCEIVEKFETGMAADAFAKAHVNSPSHIRLFYFGEK